MPPVSPQALGQPRFDHFDPFGLHRKLQEQQRLSLSLASVRPGGPNSIYEIAALTQELNTLQLTTRVRETLAANNIGQKVSARAKCVTEGVTEVIFFSSLFPLVAVWRSNLGALTGFRERAPHQAEALAHAEH